MQLDEDELKVLVQLMKRWNLNDGSSVFDVIQAELKEIDTAPYVVGFKPGPDEIRLHKPDWELFVKKLKVMFDLAPRESVPDPNVGWG